MKRLFCKTRIVSENLNKLRFYFAEFEKIVQRQRGPATIKEGYLRLKRLLFQNFGYQDDLVLILGVFFFRCVRFFRIFI